MSEPEKFDEKENERRLKQFDEHALKYGCASVVFNEDGSFKEHVLISPADYALQLSREKVQHQEGL